MNLSPQPRRLGRPLIRRDAVGSTMDEILALARLGASEGTVVVADHQTAARGRADRVWTTPAGSALLFSILLRPNLPVAELPTLSLLSALAVTDAISHLYDLSAQIKWPNDVMLDGRKCCGILLRSHMLPGESFPFVVLGIGLNANIGVDDLLPTATSLSVASGRDVDRDELLQEVLKDLELLYQSMLAGDYQREWVRLTSRLAFLGEQVMVQDGSRELTGTLLGLGERGELLLRNQKGESVAVFSGDVTRGPRPIS
ncbi:MAG: biotin--[acetyl-CoA-carboxylase] ligase [Thermomicrobiales bacterium]